MTTVYFYLLVGVLCAAFALRAPELVRHWRDPLVRSVALLLPLGAAIFFFAAPPTISQVNTLTGIPNFSVPLVYGIVTAGSAALINLTITWRGGAEDRRRAATRWCVCIYGALIATQFTLFALGDPSEERLRDFDTYYATTPYLREMVILYVLAYGLANLVLARLCWRWSREISGLLRNGLLLIVTGSVLSMGYVACKLLAIGARWTGHDWDGVSTTVAPTVSSLASLLQCIGLVLPSASQGVMGLWRRWSQYRRLRPLWLTARAVTPYELVRIPWSSSLSKRQLRRTCDIRDGLRLIVPRLGRHTDGERQADALPSALKPDAAHHVALVGAALDALRGTQADPGECSIEDMLSGDDEQLLRLSDALRVLAVLEKTSGRESGRPSPLQGTADLAGPLTETPPTRLGSADG
ncbi:MAB_1171c family putative transporter [Streptomyces sp. NPDC002033]|uniref:MAB_1171c family putative transporter n=1 Tax=unclassified Streptomyces TaxID=2593676 RepID=UPI00332823BE